MLASDVQNLIEGQESSRVEFKRDNCSKEDLGKEITALLNHEGGFVLLGVEDDGQISGLTRPAKQVEEWVMNIARDRVQPPPIPLWEAVDMGEAGFVGVVKIPADSAGKPHKARSGRSWVTYVRVGSESRLATREEEGWLYRTSKMVRYEIQQVSEMGIHDLDRSRLASYFRDVLRRTIPEESDNAAWIRLLLNSDLLVKSQSSIHATVAGLLLFGITPNRRLPQAGVTAAVFPRDKKDYDMIDEERIRGPLTPVVSKDGVVVEKGVIDNTVDFITRNMGIIAWLDGARRLTKPAFPTDAIREALVNAVVHRDYSHEGTDIEVSLFVGRLEVISPGRLPNGVTVEKMKEGIVRVARNELLKEILRDYRYIEHQGMGVRNRIIESMQRHNGTEPDLIEEEDRFIVRLWKDDIQQPLLRDALLSEPQ